jgi:peptide chain release factor 3
VYDRLDGLVHLFHRAEDHGATRATSERLRLDDPALAAAIGEAALERLREELELLEVAGAEWSREALASGETTLVFFGSALTNFGVEALLARFLELSPPPAPRESTRGVLDPVEAPFSGFVFKVQANMDPKHRDRIAFLRICTGRFEPGMEAWVARTGKKLRLAQPQEFLARERSFLEVAVAGDVVGLHDRGSLRVGDTLSLTEGVLYPGVPRFSPEQFALVRLPDPMRRKHLDRGLRHLAEEGTILLLYAGSDAGPVPIVGAVGRLQFEVLIDRLDREYQVTATLEPLSFRAARWVTGPEVEIRRIAQGFGRKRVADAEGMPMLLFESEWLLERTTREEKALTFHDVQPRSGAGS